MTYGVYSKDLKGCSISGVSKFDAMYLCYGDMVVCSEKKITRGFSIIFNFDKDWEWYFKPRLGLIKIGFIGISWHKRKKIWADKIVERNKKEKVK